MGLPVTTGKNYLTQKTSPPSRRALPLTDRDVELMRKLHEEYPYDHVGHMGYKALGIVFQVPWSTARDICKYRRRTRGYAGLLH